MRQTRIIELKSSSIRYLEQREKQTSRALYEAAFPEDSKEFIDYYYEWKTKDNEVIVMEGAGNDRAFHVMIHLNPYELKIYGNTREVPYIVAVATDVRYRRQGKMGQVMERALQDMEHNQIPFTFLLPADPAYYRGQGFVFFPRQDYLERGGVCFAVDAGKDLLKAASLDEPVNGMYKAGWKRAGEKDCHEMALFSNRILADKCEIFIKRDESYYRRLLKELAPEHGGALLLKEPASEHGGGLSKEPELCGILLYSVSGTEQKTAEIKELLLMDSISREEAECICRDALKETGCAVNKIRFTSSRMMVRLTNLRALVPLLRSERRTILYVKVTDTLINENNGCFRIEINRAWGRISEISEESVRQQMDIGQLAQTLFQHTSVYLNEWV
jgi:hypothetical protein